MSWIDGFHFPLDEETRMAQETARSFAEKEVLPLAVKIDKEHYFPKELVPKMGALGFMGVTVPTEYGGAGLTNVAYCLIIEELAAACATTAIISSAHNSLCISPINEFGNAHTLATHFAFGFWVIWIIAHQTRHIERGRQTSLPVF